MSKSICKENYKKIIVYPLGIIIETFATTYHELTIEYLGKTNYYFTSSPIGMRQFGNLPKSGIVYIRQQTTLKCAVEELVTDDPIIVDIDNDGKGVIELQIPIPRGFKLYLRQIHFTNDPGIRHFHLNGDGPIEFEYCKKVGILQYELQSFQSILIFTRINYIEKAIIHMVPCNAQSAIEMFFPGTSSIVLSDYFKFIEMTFYRFEDYSYRCTWYSKGRKLRAIELPTGFLNWHILVKYNDEELLLNNKNGIAAANIDGDRIEIILIPPDILNVKSVKTRIYYD